MKIFYIIHLWHTVNDSFIETHALRFYILYAFTLLYYVIHLSHMLTDSFIKTVTP